MHLSRNKTQIQASEHPQAFLDRQRRMDDAMHLRIPDRVPVAPLFVHYYPTRSAGISNRDAMYEIKKTLRTWEKTVVKHNWDAAASVAGSLVPAFELEVLGLKQLKWPGKGLAEDQPHKWVEKEYMTQDEYEKLLSDPNKFAVKNLWPRISETLSSASEMFDLERFSFLHLSSPYALSNLMGKILTPAPAIHFLKKALELAKACERDKNAVDSYYAEIMSMGFPIHSTAVATPAFDWVSENLRGLRGSLLDMYQVPDKLLATLEMVTSMSVNEAALEAKSRRINGVLVPMHRGAVEFMSDRQLDKFYWPFFKSLLFGLIDSGLTPIPIFEGDYTRALKILRELPPGKIVGHFDRIDRKKAKKLIGDVMCFWGNVSSELLCRGTVQQIKDDVKQLIDIFGDNGGLIIDGAMGIPDDAKPENVQAMTNAVHEYGIY